jgi:hypothetical protein
VIEQGLRGCRSRVQGAKSLMISKVRMFYGGLSTDFSTSGVENVSKKLRSQFQVSGFKFQVSGFKFQVSGSKFQVSGSKLTVQAFESDLELET